jgi:hypothetical protein
MCLILIKLEPKRVLRVHKATMNGSRGGWNALLRTHATDASFRNWVTADHWKTFESLPLALECIPASVLSKMRIRARV